MSSRSSSARRALLLVAAALIGARASFGATVTVEMGARGETNRFTVEAPGMAGGGGPRDNWVTSGPAAVIPASEPGVRVNGPAPDAGQRFPQLTRPASAVVPVLVGRPANLDDVVGGGGLEDVATLTAGAGGTFTAARDGKVRLEPLLSTYAGAKLVVRLLDAGGAEVKYGGSSLLEWTRTDDTSNQPLSFEGKRDPSSMQLQKTGDYSPATGLAYEVAIQAGQRIVVEVTGTPANQTVIKIKSSAGMK